MPAPSKMMERKPPVEFTPERKEQFLEAYRQTGLLYRSAELAGISLTTLHDHKKKDQAFAEACEEAKQCWVDEVLVAEAVRRATEGCEEPIIGGKERDTIVAYKKVYSDGLMTALLRANRQEFRTGESEAGGGPGSSPVMFIPMAVPGSMDEWEDRFSEAAKGQGGRE